ncbi:MAG: hypothetical protein WC867_00955 [Candidatus Pacearchaeota archaeon]|jgi:uncharacterized membrane protein YgcG
MVEIPVINVDLNVDKFKPENLVWGDKYDKKKDKKKIYKILAYLAVIAALIIFFRFALLAYLYIANLPKINSYDANIERIALSEDGKQAYIKLTGGNQKEIESIKFIFRTNESEFIYETTDGIKEITYEDKRFLTYFANPEYEGSYDYSINAIDMGLDNFKGIIKVEVSIKFKDEKTGEVKETKTIDSSKKSDINIVRSGGSGSGGGGGGAGGSGGSGGTSGNEPITTCNPTKTCLNYANLCGSRMSDGCNNILDCSANCKTGEACLGNSCVSSEINLPLTFETPYNLPTGGKTWYVHDTGNININGINLQATINNASLGDVIILDAGVVYYGNFLLPNKSGNGWIYIISSNLSSMPEGDRVGPKDSINMPKILANPEGGSCYTALFTLFEAHNYRLSGIEILTEGCVYSLVRMGYDIKGGIWNSTPAKTIEQLPYNITLDRCYIHSINDSVRSRIGVIADGRYIAIIDSYISNIKDSADAQAILNWNGLGPFKYVNNFLESSGENFMPGGNDPAIIGLVPSDFEIRGNYFFKPLYWKENHSSYRGYNWGIKNLFEIKNAKRLLVSGNIFENSWIDAQMGYAIVLKASNDGGNANWSTFTDMIFQDNIIKNSVSGIMFSANEHYNGGTTEGIKRVIIKNNLIDFTNSNNNLLSEFNTDFLVSFRGGGVIARDIIVDHNTMLSQNNSKSMITAGDSSNQYENVRITNNILRKGYYGFKASSTAEGNNSVNYITNCSFRKNLMIENINLGIYPSNNLGVNDMGGVGFVDFINKNYRLTSLSLGKNRGTDGKDLGADIDSIEYATRCTLDGKCHTQCVPQCANKECGSDGCYGTCGSCGNGEFCNSNGQCENNIVNELEPELPRFYVDTSYDESYNRPADIIVRSGENLQAALDSVQSGQILEIEAGASFMGNYVIRNKTGNDWIYIRSSRYSELPVEGNRVNSNDSDKMARIICPNQFNPALKIDPGVKNVRLIGLDITTNYSLRNDAQYGVLRVAQGGSNSFISENIIIDRCYIHGTLEGNIRDGLMLYQVKGFGLIDSYISEIHSVGYESHPIHIYITPGPTKIKNNYIEGAGINLFIGDNNVSIIPEDIEIIGNYFYKPLTWMIGHSTYAGINWLVKNLFEIKAGRRILVKGNIFENVWIHAQHGQVFVITPRGGEIEDLTITNNVARNFYNGVNFNSADVSINRLLFKDNLLYQTSFNISPTIIQLAGTPGKYNNVNIIHNSFLANPEHGWIVFNGARENEVNNLNVKDNIAIHGNYGIFGNTLGVGIRSVNFYSNNYNFTHNLLINNPYINMYQDNITIKGSYVRFNSSNLENVGFIDYANKNYRLSQTSPYKNLGSDGKDLGADINTLEEVTRCAKDGMCN